VLPNRKLRPDISTGIGTPPRERRRKTEQNSRRTRGPESGPLKGAVQRKSAQVIQPLHLPDQVSDAQQPAVNDFTRGHAIKRDGLPVSQFR
jgi:hypothetical protein